MKALPLIVLAIASYTVAQAANEAQIDISGNLIAPPCTASFPTTQQISLGNVNLNELIGESSVSTDVPLVFNCQPGTQVMLTLSAGMGQASSRVLLTSRTSLGLQIQLRDNSDGPGIGLSETGTWSVGIEPLTLTLRVKPVSLSVLPEPGTYSVTLLMQMTYR